EVTANLPADPVLDGVTVTAMREILGNLLLNAVQATGRGGRVTTESGTDGDGRLRVSVTDEGIGVPRAMQEKVFEPCFTTKQRGTGLGLAIVARRARDIDA